MNLKSPTNGTGMLPLPSLFIESSDIITATSQSREVQRKDDGAGIRRARFHLSIMDTNSLMPGQDFEELGDNYVIFITENDVLKKGLPLYTIDRSIRETGERIDDGSHILYVNGAMRDTKTPLGKLMHDFFCVDPDKMWYPVLAKRTRYFKEDERGINEMGSLYERLLSEGEARGLKMGEARGLKMGEARGRKEGRKEGRQEERKIIMERLITGGIAPDMAARFTGLTGA